jgi:hypothetical protein
MTLEELELSRRELKYTLLLKSYDSLAYRLPLTRTQEIWESKTNFELQHNTPTLDNRRRRRQEQAKMGRVIRNQRYVFPVLSLADVPLPSHSIAFLQPPSTLHSLLPFIANEL